MEHDVWEAALSPVETASTLGTLDTEIVRRFLCPRSIAIVGASSKPGAASQVIVKNLVDNGYDGELHLIGRAPGRAGPREILPGIDALERAVDLAVLAVPASAVLDTMAELAERRVGRAVCFASGFAEMGDEGRRLQDEIGAVARQSGVRLVGPNCVGYRNFVDGVHVAMVDVGMVPAMARELGPGIAVVAQSGSAGAHIAASLTERGVPISYSVTTGNEADVGLTDFVEYFVEDQWTGGIIGYVEQIRDPARFLGVVARASAAGKHLVVIYPGRSAAGRAAARSHTGALTGDHRLVEAVLRYAGVAVVETLEEAIDVGQLLLRFPRPAVGGLGVITGSGSICTIAQDYCESIGVAVPALSDATAARLAGMLPEYLSVGNPLDVGTGIVGRPEMLSTGLDAFAAEPAIGSVLASFPAVPEALSGALLRRFIDGTGKPSIYVVQAEDRPLWESFERMAHGAGAVIMRSPERAMRALAALIRVAEPWAADRRSEDAVDRGRVSSRSGPIPEWRAKEVLSAFGVPVPAGALAVTVDDAVRIAQRIGYPVVVKVQAAELTHKTDVGGVALGIADEAQLRAVVPRLYDTVRGAVTGIEIDGMLVETMVTSGLELVVGARRDRQWGVVVMVGLGGIWIDALDDVRLMPPDLTVEAIAVQLRSLRAGSLLAGARGGEPVDVEAVAGVVAAVGTFMTARTDVVELDLNPVVATRSGVTALDALIVTEGR